MRKPAQEVKDVPKVTQIIKINRNDQRFACNQDISPAHGVIIRPIYMAKFLDSAK